MRYCTLIGLLAFVGWSMPMQQAAAQTWSPLGVFAGGVDTAAWPANDAAFEGSMGQSAGNVSIFTDYKDSMSAWANSASYSAGWLAKRAPTAIPIVSVGLVPGSAAYNESTAVAAMNAVAAGTDDAVFAGIINAFKAKGVIHMDLRIGWEQDGAWYLWQATRDATTAAAYNAAFQHVADLAHNHVAAYPITGIQVKTVWSPCQVDWVANPVSTSYPGDAYVDIIAPDCYSNTWNLDLLNWGTGGVDGDRTSWAANPINREHYWDLPNASQWVPASTGGWGILAGIAFAKAHNKPFGLAEAGAGNNGTNLGPVDEGQFPYYLANRLSSAMEQGVSIAFINIWDLPGNFDYSDGSKPNEEASWYQFVGTMAAARKVSEPFGVDYAIGNATSTPGSGTGPYSLVGNGKGYLPGFTADLCNFIALPQEGDGSFVVRLTSQSILTGQTGVMLRAGMRPGDAYAALYVSGTQCTFIGRAAAGAASVQIGQVDALSNPWLKIERFGSTLVGCQSTDGKRWSFVGSAIIPTPSNAYIGVAISSGSSAKNTATVDDVNAPNDVIVDESAATVTGPWTSATATLGSGGTPLGYGGSFLTDNNDKSTTYTVAYTPNLPSSGNYDIYAWYTPGSTNGGSPTRANNVPLTIANKNGSTSLVFDQTAGLANQWNYVGTASMVSGTGNTVTLSNAGTTDFVVADALRFVRNPAPAGATIGCVTPAPSAVDLLPNSVVDWAHWGGTTSSPSAAWDHATLPTPQISNWSAIGATDTYNGSTGVGYSWTGSEGPNTAATASTRCIYRQAVGDGFQFQVTTGSVPQILNVYAGRQWMVTSKFQLLDSTGATLYSNTVSGAFINRATSNYALSLSPNSTYTIQYTQTAGFGNIDLEAATLSNAPY